MRTIIAGGRDFDNTELLKTEVGHFEENHSRSDLIVICGEARGADRLGKQWALENGRTVRSFPAEWDTYGKSAGYIRNSEMADYAESLIAFWDGKSKGTKNMIDLALRKGLVVKVVRYSGA